jgi:hypothetical protein
MVADPRKTAKPGSRAAAPREPEQQALVATVTYTTP